MRKKILDFEGVLSGKYTPANPPSGPRGRIYTPEFLAKVKIKYTLDAHYIYSNFYSFLKVG